MLTPHMKFTHIDLGLTPYTDALATQLHYLQNVSPNQGVILTVEHPPVITIGKNADTQHILIDPQTARQRGIDIQHTERGGNVTLHSPGQLVVYPIFKLNTPHAVRAYVSTLEHTIISTLANFSIHASTKPRLPGVWVAEKKIANIGIRIKHRTTYHGLALNVANDLSLFKTINPCGLKNVQATSMQEILQKPVPLKLVKEKFVAQLCEGLCPHNPLGAFLP